MKKRIALALLILLVALAAVLAIRTMVYPWRQQIETAMPAPIDIEVEGVARRLAEAVQFRTISYDEPSANDPAQFVAFREWLQRTYPLVHKNLRREIAGDFSLLYTWPGTDATLDPVMLLAHMDVTPVQTGSEKSWTHPPFGGVVSDGYIWGRGTLDMKASLVGILDALERKLTRGPLPRRTIMLGFGHDEEAGGAHGAKEMVRLLKDRGVHLEWVLDEGSMIADGIISGLEPPLAPIGIAEKGYLTIDIIASASGGHTSMPPYDTAVTKLARAVTRVQDNPLPAEVDGAAAGLLSSIGPYLPISSRTAIANQWLFGSYLKNVLSSTPAMNAVLRTTFAPTMLSGSPKDNVLPTEARATINIRIHPRDTVDSVQTYVRGLFKNDADIRIETVPGFMEDPARASSTESAGFRLIEKTIREVFPKTIVAPYVTIGATDARHYADIADSVYRFVPFVVTSGDLDRIHGTNERISVEGIGDVTRFYIRLLDSIE